METEPTTPRAAYTEIADGIYQHVVTGETILAGEILEYAITHKDSLLHNVFEWNDARAACLFRLEQCKKLLGSIMLNADGKEDLQIPKEREL